MVREHLVHPPLAPAPLPAAHRERFNGGGHGRQAHQRARSPPVRRRAPPRAASCYMALPAGVRRGAFTRRALTALLLPRAQQNIVDSAGLPAQCPCAAVCPVKQGKSALLGQVAQCMLTVGGSQLKIAAFCFHTETSSPTSANSFPCHVTKKTIILTQNNTKGVRPGFKYSGSPADILQQQPAFGLQGSGSSPATVKELIGGVYREVGEDVPHPNLDLMEIAEGSSPHFRGGY